MEKYDEKVALCALNKVFGYHPRLGRELAEAAGGALPLFEGALPPIIPRRSRPISPRDKPSDTASAGRSDERRTCPPSFEGAFPHPELMAQLTPELLESAVWELEQVRARGFRFIGLGEEDYPAPLLECEDPPLGLYLNGSSSPAEIFSLRPLVGVVGTRDISPYGKSWCRKLVEALAAAPVQPAIVSGMAYGADFIAHDTALRCGIPTIGVLPTGIETIYPRQHERLAVTLVGTPGCGLVTDYPMGTAPVALNFLRRNRIIAGLVRGVIVIESKSKGGSLMTARYACEYNRDVFALPGRADDLRSTGCNSLIASHMAELIASPEALVEALGLSRPSRRSGGAGQANRSREDALRTVLERQFGPASPVCAVGMAIQGHRGAFPDDIAAFTGLPAGAVLESIGRLEAAGLASTDLLRRCTIAPAYD